MKECPYRVLGLARTADEALIRKTYRRLALETHPDKNPEGEERFKKIAWAYELLTDKKRRQAHDRQNSFSSTTGPRRSRPPADAFRSHFDVFRELFRHDPFKDDFFNVPDHFDVFFARATREMGRKKCRKFYEENSGTDENDCRFSSTIRFTSSPSGKNALARKTSTTTRLVDGKKIETKKIEDDGSGILVEVRENGILTAKSVNGCPVPVMCLV